MIIHERNGTINVPPEIAIRRRHLRLALTFAIVGLVVLVGSCAFSNTAIGVVLALFAIALGLASIGATLAVLKEHGESSQASDADTRHAR